MSTPTPATDTPAVAALWQILRATARPDLCATDALHCRKLALFALRQSFPGEPTLPATPTQPEAFPLSLDFAESQMLFRLIDAQSPARLIQPDQYGERTLEPSDLSAMFNLHRRLSVIFAPTSPGPRAA